MYRSAGPVAGSFRVLTPSLTWGTNPAMTSAEFIDRLRVTTEFLEAIVGDRGLLAQVPPDDQHRLLQAAGHVYSPMPSPAAGWCAPPCASARRPGPPRGPGARRHRHPRPSAASRSTPAPTSSRRRSFEQRDGGRRPGRPRADRAAALLRLQGGSTPSSTTSTTSCAPRAPRSTSPSAPSRPTSRAGWRCSPAGGSRSATRPASSCSGPAPT